jgi:hypothetical protein
MCKCMRMMSSELSADPNSMKLQYTAHVLRSCLNASWFPGETSSAYKMILHWCAKSDLNVDKRRCNSELKLGLCLAQCQSIAIGCCTSVDKSAAMSILWCIGPYGVLCVTYSCLDCLNDVLFVTSRNFVSFATLITAAKAELDIYGNRAFSAAMPSCRLRFALGDSISAQAQRS